MLTLKGLEKYFGQHAAAKDVSMDVGRGDIVALLGPSGSGKTTTLRMIAGFMEPDRGTISIDGRPINGLRPYERNIGVVFQDYALFPHMSVLDNVCYGPRRRGAARDEAIGKARRYLDLVRLSGFEDRWPLSLSGGQQQRVALARALAIEPEVLLLDEPLSALDTKLRVEIRGELRDILVAAKCATIIVTHDQDEAMSLADKIYVMNEGRIVQAGVPQDVYQHPQDAFVAGFVGRSNIFKGRVTTEGGRKIFVAEDGFTIPWLFDGASESALVSFAIRPERISLSPRGARTAAPTATGRILRRLYLGQDVELTIELVNKRSFAVIQRASQREAMNIGDEVDIVVDAEGIIPLHGTSS